MGAKVAVERGFPPVDREIQRRQSSPTDFGLAAYPDIHCTLFFKIEALDCSVIFLLHFGHSQP
jgi:hypothetical protein